MIEQLRDIIVPRYDAFQDMMFDHLTERYGLEHAGKIMGYPPIEETASEVQAWFDQFNQGMIAWAENFVKVFRDSGIVETLEQMAKAFEIKDTDQS